MPGELVTLCKYCSDPPPLDHDPATGASVCPQCGIVADEATLVSEVTFGETSTGQAVVSGSYVRHDQTGARFNRRHGGSQESRDQTLANGKRNITAYARGMSLPDICAERAHMLFSLALSSNFVQGRRSTYVWASCLYVACRMEHVQRMLIDFSDFIQVNVFVLGNTYLKLVKGLNLQDKIPLIDPSLYISRFASLLEFGDETQKVAQDAIRLVARFNRDWMSHGRRPAGICGAALILAARMNHFKRSIQEVVAVVRVADVTLRKRLQEFKITPSSNLSVQDFRSVWLEESADPPSFVNGGNEGKRKRRKLAEQKAITEAAKPDETLDVEIIIDFGGGGSDEENESGPRDEVRAQAQARAQFQPTFSTLHPSNEMPPPPLPTSSPAMKRSPTAEGEEEEEYDLGDVDLENEINDQLGSALSQALIDECDTRDTTELELINSLEGLDEEELDNYILTRDEVRIKEKIWVIHNKDYLEGMAAKHLLAEQGETRTIKRRPRKSKKGKGGEVIAGQTAADAAQQMLSKKRFSRRLDPNLITHLFDFDREEVSRASSVIPSSPAYSRQSSPWLDRLDPEEDEDGLDLGVAAGGWDNESAGSGGENW